MVTENSLKYTILPIPDKITQQFRTNEMTYPIIQEKLKKTPLVIVPTGSHEQHGPHLPFGTDALIAKTITEFAAANLITDHNVLVTPLLPYGSSTEHLAYGGTWSIKYQTLRNVLTDLVDSIVLAGVKKILIVNGHGGNSSTIGSILHDMTYKHKIFIGFTEPTRLMKEAYQKLAPPTDKGPFHAGDLETSVLLHIAPHLVDEPKITSHTPIKYYNETKYVRLWDSKLIKNFGWTAKDIAPTGVIGDPSFATADKGKILFRAAIQNLMELIKEIISMT